MTLPGAQTPAADSVGELAALVGTAVERAALVADGKSGARLQVVRVDDGRTFVVKDVDPRRDWIMRATGDTGRVARLWASGALARVPSVIDHAVEVVVAEAAGCVAVMRDQSNALFPPGHRLSRARSDRILAAAAALHAAFLGTGPPDGVAPLAELYCFLSPAPARRFSAEAEVPRLALANLGFAGDRVVVLDWGSVTTWSPPAVDYAWFLAVNGASVDATHDELLDDVRCAGGAGHDEEAMRLALLGSLAQLGWKKALGATEAADGAVRRRERDDLGWWAVRAREGLQVWGEG